MAIEQTLIILKPDGVQRGFVGEIISRFEKAGLKIVAMKMVNPDRDHYFEHYETISQLVTRKGEKIFNETLDLMTKGPVIPMVIQGNDAVDLVRKMVGPTEPKAAAPGTIRGDYAHVSYARSNEKEIGVPNLIHASGEVEEAKKEIPLWFSAQEIFGDYNTVHDIFM